MSKNSPVTSDVISAGILKAVGTLAIGYILFRAFDDRPWLLIPAIIIWPLFLILRNIIREDGWIAGAGAFIVLGGFLLFCLVCWIGWDTPNPKPPEIKTGVWLSIVMMMTGRLPWWLVESDNKNLTRPKKYIIAVGVVWPWLALAAEFCDQNYPWLTLGGVIAFLVAGYTALIAKFGVAKVFDIDR